MIPLKKDLLSPSLQDGVLSGRIVQRFGAQVLVEDAQGGLYRCTLRRRLQDAVCGDGVAWTHDAARRGHVVTAIGPRRNLLQRADARGQLKGIAANLRQLVIVLAPRPAPNPLLLDRYLIAAENLPAQALLVLNKCDLCSPQDAALVLLDEYAALGYAVVQTSTLQGIGLETLAARLREGTAVCVGQSGVGKSSLVQALIPGLEIRIGALSALSGEGQHTTTSAALYHLPQGGSLIDSPGLRDFIPQGLDKAALQQGFVEIRALAGECRFHNCLHLHEPGCAVQAAVARGQINARRYAHYRTLLTQEAMA